MGNNEEDLLSKILSNILSINKRTAALEYIMTNHLRSHERINKYLLFPILVGVIIMLLKELIF